MYEKTIQYDPENGIIIDLQFRGRITVVGGDTATGKTYISQLFEQQSKLDKLHHTDSVFANMSFYRVTDDLAGILNEENKFIIIDNADYLFEGNADIVEAIGGDYTNQYLIFARCAMGLSVPPTQLAELIQEGNVIRLAYLVE